MAAPPDSTPVPAHPSNTLTTDRFDLEPYREQIEELYIKNGLPLKKVMDILKEKGCLATRNMYLRKFSTWGFKKNFNHNEMVQLLIQIRSRGNKSSPRKFMVNGQEVTEAEVLRYFTRRERALDRANRQMTGITVQNYDETQLPTRVNPSLNLPDPLISQQKALYTIYITQCSSYAPFKGGVMPTQDVSSESLQTQLYRNFLNGAQTLHHQPRAGGAILERGFRMITPLVTQADHHLIPVAIFLIGFLLYHKEIVIVEMLARHLYQASLRIHGPTHLLTLTFRALFQNYGSSWIMALAAQLCYDASNNSLGRHNEEGLIQLFNVVTGLRASNGSFDEIALKYRMLIAEGKYLEENNLLTDKSRIPQYQQEFGSFLATNGRYAEGISMIKESASLLFDENVTDKVLLAQAIHSYMDLAALHIEQPEFEGFQEDQVAYRKRYLETEAMMKTALEKAKEIQGPTSTFTLRIAHLLAEFYRERGHPDKSREQYEIFQESLQEFALSS